MVLTFYSVQLKPYSSFTDCFSFGLEYSDIGVQFDTFSMSEFTMLEYCNAICADVDL